jgi:CRP-like cAMP-binding protein
MSATPAILDVKTEDDASPSSSPAGEPVSEYALIETFKPFASLPPAVKKAITDISQTRNYDAGETLFALGQFDGAEFLLIAAGELKVSRMDAKTGSMHVNAYAAGQAFGLAAAVSEFDNHEAEQLTMAVEPGSRIMLIDAAGFRDIVVQRPSLTKNLMQHFAAKLAQGGEHVAEEDLSPERRVYAALMEMTERDPVSGDFRILKMPKHREIAERAGVEEPFAAQAIAQIIQDGVARRDYPGMVICDMTEFSRLAS